MGEEVRAEFGLNEQTRLGSKLADFESEISAETTAAKNAEDLEAKLRKQHEEELKQLEAQAQAKLKKDKEEAERKLEEHKKKLLADQERLKEQRLKEAGNAD